MKSTMKLKDLIPLNEETGFIPTDLEEDLALLARGNDISVKDVLQLFNAVIDSKIKPDDAFTLKLKKKH